jgi:Domain of unknown function (DUF3859)
MFKNGIRGAALAARAAATLGALVLATALLAAGAQAGDVHRITIVDFGIYEHKVQGFEPEPRHISRERVIVTNVTLLRSADEVDAQRGRMIGFQFRVTDPALLGQTLTIRRIVPPLTNPKTGETATLIERDIVVSQEGQLMLNAYRFDYDWEMAEGLWRFQVIHNGRVIAEKTIKVILAMN